MEGKGGGGEGGRRGGETETEMNAYTYRDLSHQFLILQTFKKSREYGDRNISGE